MNEFNEMTAPLIDISKEELTELAKIKDYFLSKAMLLIDKKQTSPINLVDIYPKTNNVNELYAQISDLKKCLDSFRPFDKYQMKHLNEIFDTEYTYASNRIEGNTLTLKETSFVINEGLTIQNKSMKDHLEAINHKGAIDFIREMVDNKEPLNERNIKLIHSLILQGIDRENAGVYRGVSVGIKGTHIIFPEPFIVPKMMEDLMVYYEAEKNNLHPIALATQMHSRLVNIHPFIDGNGRTSRLVMNLILLQHGYPVTIFEPEEDNRDVYFNALNIAREQQNIEDFELFVMNNVKRWMFKYLSLLAPNISEGSKNKGYYFFKKIEPSLKNEL